jgi:VWFA-related protein
VRAAVGLAVAACLTATVQNFSLLSPHFPLLSPHFSLPQTSAQQQTPTFRSGVEYVTVDVVVTDRDDRPITDLTVDDFELFEEGRPQTIADFAFMYTPVMTREIEIVPVDAPPADVVTNTPPPRMSRLFVVIVDDLHIIKQTIVPLKRLLTDFLRALTPDDQVALTFVGRSDLSQDFTNDIGALLRAVDNVTESIGFGWGAVPALRLDYLGDARSTTYVLRNIARTLADVDHPRRAIVYVSGGLLANIGAFPCPVLSANRSGCSNQENEIAIIVREELNDIYEEAARSGVPIYTIDPRGLATPETSVDGWVGGDTTLTWRRIRIQQDRLSEIAINTGGRAFINRSNVTDAVRELVAENGAYYLLGYYPDPFDPDGEFHPVEVRVKRPGLRVRARKGYVAENPADQPEPGQASINAALGRLTAGGDIALRAFAAPLAIAGGRTRTSFLVEAVYPADARPDTDQDELILSVVAVDSDGRIRADAQRTVQATIPPESDPLRVVAIDGAIDVPDEDVTLRFGVASRALGRTATVYLPVEVPDLSDGDIQMGGLVIGSDLRRAPTLGTPPLLQTPLPFQPTLSREFSRADALRVFTRLRWDAARGTPAISLTLRGDDVVVTKESPVTDIRDDGREREGTIDTPVTLAGVLPGAYTLEVAARLTNGRVVVRRVAIDVRE